VEQLISELERVTVERDELASLMKGDAVTLHNKIATATKQGL